MGLKEYKKKRDFKATPEPVASKKSAKEPIFVVQEHHASHLHYDFRLEAFGTLKSWAVPKGPPEEVGERRLAVEVEDHPISYATFKGTIPEGHYGAGKVKIWDHGTWVPPKGIRKAFKDGKIEFELKGKKLKGRWILVRSKNKSGKKNQWLLLKGHDKKETTDKTIKKTKKVVKGAKRTFPSSIKPQLATLVASPPKGTEWIHEIKLDGYRTLAKIQSRSVQMLTRSGLDWTSKYETIASDLKKLPIKNALIDGEIIVRDEQGRSGFNELQEELSEGDGARLEFVVFDLLYLDGRDLTSEPLDVRKSILEDLVKAKKLKHITFSEHFLAQGEELFEKACELGLEGIISKNRTKPYYMTRNTDWLKIKCIQRQEFVIGGFTKPAGSRAGFGSLLLGVYHKNSLRYVGRVGTGFSDDFLKSFSQKLKKLEVRHNPFTESAPKDSKSVHWVKPTLICEVEFRAWTADQMLRQAAFVALRSDKPAKEIRQEVPVNIKESKKKAESFQITHPDRVLYKKDHITKQDVANYYNSIADYFLKYAKNRPMALLRCVDSTSAGCFFQKHLGNTKATEVFEASVENQQYMHIHTKLGLMQLVQSGALEFHLWQSHDDEPDNPDQIVFDLDPDEKLPWGKVVEAAFEVKKLLEGLSLKSFVKTTGGKGLHVQVPIAAKYDFDTIKEFSKTLCRYLETQSPEKYTTNISKKARGKKVFLDYLRNGFGATAIAPFSLRAKDHAYASVPISWDELKKMKQLKNFEIKDVLKRLAKQKKDPWADYGKLKQRIRLLEKQQGTELHVS